MSLTATTSIFDFVHNHLPIDPEYKADTIHILHQKGFSTVDHLLLFISTKQEEFYKFPLPDHVLMEIDVALAEVSPIIKPTPRKVYRYTMKKKILTQNKHTAGMVFFCCNINTVHRKSVCFGLSQTS
jgi:hypothetical protein